MSAEDDAALLASVTFLEDIRAGRSVRDATTRAPVDSEGWIVGLDSDDGSLGPTWHEDQPARPVEDRDDWDLPDAADQYDALYDREDTADSDSM